MASGIYGIHNLINDKWYVGQAVNIRARWNAHKSMLSRNERESIHLLRAWQKYGPDAFEWVILEECSPEVLDEREKYWISQKDSYKNGYNRTLGGGGIHGYQITKEHKEKIKKATLAKWADPEHRKVRLNAMRTATDTDEYRSKISEAGKKNWADPDFKKLSLKRMQEGACNPESIEKRKASLRKAFQNPESKEKLSEASRQNWKSPDYRKKMEAARAEFMDETYRERAKKQSIERWKSKDYRKLVITNLSKSKREKAAEVVQVETGHVFNSIADAADELGISYHHILMACYGKRRKAGEFHWRFAKETQGEWDAKRAAFIKETGIKAYPKVVCIETGEIFEQPKAAGDSVGVHASNITKVCRGIQLSAGDKHWRYLDEPPELKAKREALLQASVEKKTNEHSRIRIRCLETQEIYNSVSEAAKALNINRSGISNALRGKAKTAGPYHWEYVDEIRPAKYGKRQIICVETSKVYQSVQQAATELNINRSSISNALRGKTERAGNKHWKYYEVHDDEE